LLIQGSHGYWKILEKNYNTGKYWKKTKILENTGKQILILENTGKK